MKVLQSVLALVLVLALGCATPSIVSAATIEEAAASSIVAADTIEGVAQPSASTSTNARTDCRTFIGTPEDKSR